MGGVGSMGVFDAVSGDDGGRIDTIGELKFRTSTFPLLIPPPTRITAKSFRLQMPRSQRTPNPSEGSVSVSRENKVVSEETCRGSVWISRDVLLLDLIRIC